MIESAEREDEDSPRRRTDSCADAAVPPPSYSSSSTRRMRRIASEGKLGMVSALLFARWVLLLQSGTLSRDGNMAGHVETSTKQDSVLVVVLRSIGGGEQTDGSVG